MFAIDIIPLEENSKNSVERFFLGEPVVYLGNMPECHLQHPAFQNLNFKIAIQKLPGSEFQCQQIFTDQNKSKVGFQDIYDSTAKLNLGAVKLLITSLDSDLLMKEGEAPDQAGYRLLKQAITGSLSKFPALQITKPITATVSFDAEDILTVGRAPHHHLVLDHFDISSTHARFGYSKTKSKYWVEDLGSTNGTFIKGQQVSGKTYFASGDSVMLGASTIIVGVDAKETLTLAPNFLAEVRAAVIPTTKIDSAKPAVPEELLLEDLVDDVEMDSSLVEQLPADLEELDLTSTLELPEKSVAQLADTVSKYPILLALNKVARPGKLILKPQQSVSIGRDSSCDLWLGAPYVSRQHARVTLNEFGEIKIEDTSSNGTAYSAGMIPAGGELVISHTSEILHFGSGLAVAICFSADDEELFIRSGGRADAFLEARDSTKAPLGQVELQVKEARTKDLAHRPLRPGSKPESPANRIWNKFLNYHWQKKIFICFFALLIIATFVLLISIIFIFI